MCRVITPSAYLQSQGPGRGAAWNPDREVFAGLDMLTRPDAGSQLTVTQFAIRVQEHRDTAEDLVNQILRSAGYSGQTFGLGGDVAQRSFAVLKPGGRAAFIASGAQAPKPTRGDVQSLRPQVGRDRPHLQRLAELVGKGAVRIPEITRFPLSDAVAAHRLSQSRHFRGKLVFQVR